RICRLGDGWEVWSRSWAAVVRLPSSTTATKKRRCLNSIAIPCLNSRMGIGGAAAVAFAKKGAKVVVAGRRDEAGKAPEAEFINADVRKEDDVRNMVDKTVARFGRLDVAV